MASEEILLATTGIWPYLDPSDMSVKIGLDDSGMNRVHPDVAVVLVLQLQTKKIQ